MCATKVKQSYISAGILHNFVLSDVNPATLVFIPRDSRGFRENPLIRIPVQVSSLDCHCSGCVHAEQSRACAMTRVDSVDNMPRKDAVPALRSTSTPTTANTRAVFAVYTHQSTVSRSVCLSNRVFIARQAGRQLLAGAAVLVSPVMPYLHVK